MSEIKKLFLYYWVALICIEKIKNICLNAYMLGNLIIIDVIKIELITYN